MIKMLLLSISKHLKIFQIITLSCPHVVVPTVTASYVCHFLQQSNFPQKTQFEKKYSKKSHKSTLLNKKKTITSFSLRETLSFFGTFFVMYSRDVEKQKVCTDVSRAWRVLI